MRISLAVLIVATWPSGPTAADKRAENDLWAALLSTRQEIYRNEHTCDEEYKANRKAEHGAAEAIGNHRMWQEFEDEAQKTEIILNGCLRHEPDFVDDGGKLVGFANFKTTEAREMRERKAADDWLDACLRCAAAQECVSRSREVTRLMPAEIPAYAKPALCQ